MTKRETSPVGRRPSWRRALWSLAAIPLFAPIAAAHAEPSTFQVPEQSLATALRQIADNARVQVLFTPEQTKGLRSRPVIGRYEALEALRKAVGDADLEVAQVSPIAFAVRTADRPAPRAASPSTAPGQVIGGDIIVTGRRPGDKLRKSQAAFAVTVIGETRLASLAPIGLADVLKLTPGFWVESSGGEASNNVRARGVPLDGYASIAVLEDGLSVQHDAGLAFLNPDQVLRPSIGIARVEVLRGGTAAIAASQAPGGALNVISRAPPEQRQGEIRAQTSRPGDARFDVWAGGPIGGAWRFGFGGFWREGEGARDTGFTADRGGSARFALTRAWSAGEANFAIKRIDDRVAFFLPVPLRLAADGAIGSTPDFDAKRATLLGGDLLGFDPSWSQGAGAPAFRIDDGTRVRLTQITAKADFTVSDDWRLEAAVRHRDSDTNRNGLFPRTPTAAASRLSTALPLAQARDPLVAAVDFRLSRSGDAWLAGAEDLAIEAIASAVSVPLAETIASLRLDGDVEALGAKHTLGFGLYHAQTDARFRRAASMILLEARGNGRRLDIVTRDASGVDIGALTDGGVVRYGVQYDNVSARQSATAGFAVWEAKRDAWTIDAGARVETERLEGARETSRLTDLGGASAADDSVLRGTGRFEPFAGRFEAVNGTLGARYAIDPRAAMFARFTRATRLPSLSAYYGDASGASARPAPTESIDLGLSFEGERLALYVIGFQTRFKGFPFDETLIEPVTGAIVSRVSFASSKTLGLEVEGDAQVFDGMRIQGSLTVQEPEFESFLVNSVSSGRAIQTSYAGRQLVRVPRVMARVAPTFDLPGGWGEVGLAVEHFGPRYADAANTVRLPAYTVLSAHGRFALSARAELTIVGSNLTDTLGLTEGNPRSGQIASVDANSALFTARPIFGRSLRATLAVKF
ncbi:MAG: TonB-dependent receptor [Caulobacterales bacterium]